ncbi:MAG: diacylglycerol kinase [Pseudonocardiales bacterium]|nr:MAG: diacylglycerol kinase [Pseudonocardiales bacterium]
MRALLVVNPHATATTQRERDVLARALGSETKVDVAETEGRGHAIALARSARDDDVDLIVALGGDGTVNEVVNGLLSDGRRGDLPALAVVPGGSANVFGRSLGLSTDPIEATSDILDALRAGRSRRVGLGLADDRWFLFNAGVGFDADVVHRVEARRHEGVDASAGLYLRSALTEFLMHSDRRHPALSVHAGDARHDKLYFVIVSNTTPWSFFNRRAITLSPRASFDTGLDVVATRSMRTSTLARWIPQIFRADPHLRGRALVAEHDLPSFVVTASRPIGLQVDGDYLGKRTSVTFSAHPRVLRVVA